MAYMGLQYRNGIVFNDAVLAFENILVRFRTLTWLKVRVRGFPCSFFEWVNSLGLYL
ncbi:hypothetical protein GLYMA_15G000500v4 [Glycine max]|uniref:Uncharacterized protein n=1 Tax=Glycine max TaxID=3847 RepID=A0A0R0G3X0_SOYBN|nr:hypothetical protein JHK85_041644 [Glycine max]KAH1144748.1 hypothetical protein GYH30_040876 [Glycine max]KRH09589.1 hypothetical protein GLYMA_15G000500v4 [Glycine max]